MENALSLINKIDSFLNDHTVFFSRLKEDQFFDKELFHAYVKDVYDLSVLDMPVDTRYSAIILIWEIAFKIEESLGNHRTGDPSLIIKNINEFEPTGISTLNYYLANWFSYGKVFDVDSLRIDDWS